MSRYKVGKEGSFDKFNGHNGVCWGWPKECKLTNRQAKTLYLACYRTRSLTIHQMIVVRKALAYAYELTGGEPKGNYRGVKQVWKLVDPLQLAAAKGRVIPQRIPTVKQLKVFGKDWTTDFDGSLIEYSSGLICAHDAFLYGLRSTEDVDRVKTSFHHTYDWQQGWQCTSFKGGRAKLCGTKKGSRPWGIYTTCFCKGTKHQPPPEDFQLDKNGNPRDPDLVNWTTSCPLACLQLMWQLQSKPRRYAKWSTVTGRFNDKHNIADPVEFGIDWLIKQGATTEANRFDRNSGRKCLARYCRKLGLSYEPIFQMIGDLEEVWRNNYDNDLPQSGYAVRDQSTDPKVATYALRLFAKAILKRKVKLKPKLNLSDRIAYRLLVSREGKEAAEKALFGIESDDESD